MWRGGIGLGTSLTDSKEGHRHFVVWFVNGAKVTDLPGDCRTSRYHLAKKQTGFRANYYFVNRIKTLRHFTKFSVDFVRTFIFRPKKHSKYTLLDFKITIIHWFYIYKSQEFQTFKSQSKMEQLTLASYTGLVFEMLACWTSHIFHVAAKYYFVTL